MEVALLMVIFFTIVFTTMEIARSIYVINTLQEVTRRAAGELVRRAPGDPDSAAIMDVRRRALFRGDGGNELFFGAPVTTQHVRVEYLSLVRASDGGLTRVLTSPLPSCPTNNRRICMADPNDPGCVRFVRVRICEPGAPGTCQPVSYQPAFPFVPLKMNLPRSSTIATVETLGYLPSTEPGGCL